MWGSTDAAAGVLHALPAIVASATLVWVVGFRRGATGRPRAALARWSAGCAVASLATGFALPATGYGAGWKLAETAVLLLLLAVVTRWLSPRELAWVLPPLVCAVTLWPLPLVAGESLLESVGVIAFWLLPAAGAVAAGAYPRRQEARRESAVAAACGAQRLRLSHDLHDFVAHDISGIVVRAQAARFVAATDPAQALLALERIEEAGLRALAATDRAVRMLRDAEAPATDPSPGLAELPALVAEFASAGAMRTQVDIPTAIEDTLSREAGLVAYRIVVEALTNIRRHAPDASHTDVRLTRTAAGVEIRVTNDRGSRPGSIRRHLSRRGGLGLPGLTELARALGGTLTAGPHDPGGWRLTAVLPATSPKGTP